MAETQELIVDLRLKDDLSGGIGAAKAQLTGLETAALGTSSKIRSSFAGIGSDLKAGFAAGLGIGGVSIAAQAAAASVGFLTDSIRAAADEEAGIKRLGVTLRENVAGFDGNTDAIERQLEASQKLGFTDNDLRDSLASLSAATHNIGAAFKDQALAMDLARFKGESLAAASDELVKVQAGSFRALKGLGIELDANATSTEALAAIQRVVSGQAEAFGDTASGAMARAGVAVDKLQEKIGTGLTPIIGKAADALANLLDSPAVGAVGVGLEGAFGGFANAASGALNFGDALRLLGTPLKLVNDALHDTGQVSTGLTATFVANALSIDHDHDSTSGLAEAVRTYNALAIDHNHTLTDNVGIHKTLAQELIKTPSLMLGAGAGTDTFSDSLLTAANNAKLLELNLTDAEIAALKAFNVFRHAPNKTGDITGFGANFDSGGDLDALLAHRQALMDAKSVQDGIDADNLAKSKAAASAYADVLSQKLDRALSQTKSTADTLFDKLHTRHLQAISDVEKLAEKQHDAASQQISDLLKLKLQQDAAPVTAAEEAQRRIELSRQRRDLGAGLQAAQASGDPIAIRNATEALQSFNAAQRIDALKLTQSKLDLAAQTQAAADQKTADDALAAAKLAQAAAIKVETDRAKKQSDDFDRALTALKLRDKGASPAKFGKDLIALQERFGISTDPNGFHHIADVVGNAIKTVKIPSPIFSPTIIYQPPVFTINGRVLASYIASAQSPTATPGVRTGALSPRP